MTSSPSSSPKHHKNKKRVCKEKLRTIMEAASALTALGDEESSDNQSRGNSPVPKEPGKTKATSKKDDKRFLPDHKKPDAALTFPEKLMKMMRFAETQGDDFCIAWCEDGRSFVIRSCEEFTRAVVPKFFKPTKFSSFTRKLYRWGFRQINRGLGPDDPVIFGCAHFQRDAPEEIAQMRSVTAAGARKDSGNYNNHNMMMMADPMMTMMMQQQQHRQQQQQQQHVGTKRSFEDSIYGNQQQEEQSMQKRLLLSKLLQQQTMIQQQQQSTMFGNVDPNSALAMASMQHQSSNNYNNQGYHHSPQTNYQQQFQQYQESAAFKPYPFMPQQQPPQQAQQQQTHNPYQASQGTEPRASEIVNAALAALRNS